MGVLLLALAAAVAAGVVWLFGTTMLDTFVPSMRAYVMAITFVFIGAALFFVSIFMFTTLRIGTFGMGFLILAVLAFGWALLELLSARRQLATPDDTTPAGPHA